MLSGLRSMNPDQIRFAPINTGRYPDGIPDQKNIEFYAARSGVEIGHVLVGNIAIDQSLVPNKTTGALCEHKSWSALASVIAERGSVPGIQLSATCPGYEGLRAVPSGNHAAAFQRYADVFRKMTKERWSSVVQKFSASLHLAYGHGYRHLQIHAAHGYLWSLALDPLICPDDAPLDRLADIMNEALGLGFSTVSLRVSWNTGCSHDDKRQIRILEFWDPFKKSVELDVSNGYYNADKTLIYPGKEKGETPWLPVAERLSSAYPDSNFVFTGNVWNPLATLDNIPKNVSVGIGRPLIADPNFIESVKAGQNKRCNLCGDCHYFTRSTNSISCPLWDTVILPFPSREMVPV